MMNKTVTVTHHAEKREYQWEFVIPDENVVLLPDTNLEKALDMLGTGSAQTANELRTLPNGESRSLDLNILPGTTRSLEGLAVKSVSV